MNIDFDDYLKILKMSNYLLGKSVWRLCKNQKEALILFKISVLQKNHQIHFT